MIDPRLRQRVETAVVKHAARPDLTNAELLAEFERFLTGKIRGVAKYVSNARDAVRYFVTPEGGEVPVREWTKEAVWGYLHYIETNYCANFQMLGWTRPTLAKCAVNVWNGSLEAGLANQTHCAGCARFRRPVIRHRLNGLHKWFKFLARVGVVPTNFMTDIVSEWYEENDWKTDGEKRRNPSVAEMVRLVNGTAHPARRAFYAASAKWWHRPNEMFMLDRYASFGLQSPRGTPAGFEEGFPTHPHLLSFEDGGDLVYLPKTKGHTDKRKGNRWQVVDAELRPILEQHFAWWERTVKRDADGLPVTTALWLNESGRPLRQDLMYPRYFYQDCERLGLMQQGDRDLPRRRWSAHCQRHFGEQIRQLANVPSDWNNHFRGDAFKDARGDYYEPAPEHIRQKYGEFIPLLGFQPLPEAMRLRRLDARSVHETRLQDELRRIAGLKNSGSVRRCAQVSLGGETWIVPQSLVPSFVFALRSGRPDAEAQVLPDTTFGRGRYMSRTQQAQVCESALGMLSAQSSDGATSV